MLAWTSGPSYFVYRHGGSYRYQEGRVGSGSFTVRGLGECTHKLQVKGYYIPVGVPTEPEIKFCLAYTCEPKLRCYSGHN